MNFIKIDVERIKPEVEKRKDGTHKHGYKGAYATKSSRGTPTVKIKILGRVYILARILWAIRNGIDIPYGKIIDHIDGNPLNNDISNLRVATHRINAWNKSKQKNNTSGVCGVCFCNSRGLWVSSFGEKNSAKKRFKDFFEAVCHRKSLEAKHSLITLRHGQ